MRSLTANDAIRIWESGHRQRPAERAMTVLSAAFPEEGEKDLRRLTLGQCNTRLLEVRERVFGQELRGFAVCANCGERLEFALSSNALTRAGPVEEGEATEFELESDGYQLRFRLLDTEDLESAAASGDVNAASGLLVERCVLEARCGDRRVTVAELPETILSELARRLAECDEGADVLIDLICPACESRHQLPFDVASFFYTEISAQAQRLLREVHSLARTYGWREQEILAMSARRRQFYLEMLT